MYLSCHYLHSLLIQILTLNAPFRLAAGTAFLLFLSHRALVSWSVRSWHWKYFAVKCLHEELQERERDTLITTELTNSVCQKEEKGRFLLKVSEILALIPK